MSERMWRCVCGHGSHQGAPGNKGACLLYPKDCSCQKYTVPDAATEPKRKASYVGAPACFALEMACKQVRDAFASNDEGSFGDIYLVGSAIERPDWRDVDVRLILDDASFAKLFPQVVGDRWEFDPRWTLLMVAVTNWMRQQTGLPIDFQIQPMTHANERHNGPRHHMGARYVR